MNLLARVLRMWQKERRNETNNRSEAQGDRSSRLLLKDP